MTEDQTPTQLLDGYYLRKWERLQQLRRELAEMEESMAEYPDPTTLGDPDTFEAEPATVSPPEGQGYTLELTFKSGIIRVFEVTAFQQVPTDSRGGLAYDWKQESLREGDDCLQWVDWDEVVLIVTRSAYPLAEEEQGAR